LVVQKLVVGVVVLHQHQ